MSETKKLLTNDELELSALRALKAIVDAPVYDALDPGSQIRAAELLLGYLGWASLTGLAEERRFLALEKRIEALEDQLGADR